MKDQTKSDHTRVLALIARSSEPSDLRALIANAKRLNVREVEEAAFRKLISISPEGAPGSLEHDFWTMVNAFEYLLSDENGKTTRMSRTRQKVKRVGVAKTLEDFAIGSPTDGFKGLIDRGMPELTGEAIILRHPDRFEQSVVSAARARLLAIGYSV